jgi:hypothetical protein
MNRAHSILLRRDFCILYFNRCGAFVYINREAGRSFLSGVENDFLEFILSIRSAHQGQHRTAA